MKYCIEQLMYCPCGLAKFFINDIAADKSDFGNGEDMGGITPYNGFIGCINYKFNTKEPTNEILNKYYISESEYWEIANHLKGVLSFGECSCCE